VRRSARSARQGANRKRQGSWASSARNDRGRSEIDRGVYLGRLSPAGVSPPTTGAEDASCQCWQGLPQPRRLHCSISTAIPEMRRQSYLPVGQWSLGFNASLQRKPSAAFYTGHTGHTGHMGRHHSIWLLLPRCFSASRASAPLEFCSVCSSACSSSALDL